MKWFLKISKSNLILATLSILLFCIYFFSRKEVLELSNAVKILRSIVWNPIYNDDDGIDERRKQIMKFMIYDFLITSSESTVNSESDSKLMHIWMKHNSDESQRAEIFREIFSGIDYIQSTNCVMKKNGKHVFLIPGGSRLVKETYLGIKSCREFTDNLLKSFELKFNKPLS